MFKTNVSVTEHGDYWKLLWQLVYEGNTDRWVIPAGFITDFASIPRIFTPLLPRTGRHNRAAVLHDYLYRIAMGIIPSCTHPDGHGGCLIMGGCGLPQWLSRKDADRIFLRAMREVETEEWRARAMFLGVRASHWLGMGEEGPYVAAL